MRLLLFCIWLLALTPPALADSVRDSLLHLLEDTPEREAARRGDLLHALGNAAFAERALVEAIDYTERALDYRRRGEATDPMPVVISTFNLGLYHGLLEEYRTALDYFLQLLERPPHRKLGQTYFQMGRIYREMGSLGSAEIALEAALRHPPFADGGRARGQVLEQLANVHLMKETAAGARAARPLLERAIREYAGDDYAVLNATAATGRALNLMGEHRRAIAVLRRALAENTATVGDDELATILLTNLGIAYRRSGDYAAAARQYRRALAIDLAFADGQRPDPYVANDYNNLSSLYLHAGQPDSALVYAQRALTWLVEGFAPTDPAELPDPATLGTGHRLELQNYLLDQARAWVALGRAGRPGAFERALETYRYADASADQLRRQQMLSDTRTYWRADARTFYGEALAVAHASNDTEAALYFMEKARGRLLIDELTARRARERLPDAVRDELRRSALTVRRSGNATRELQRFSRLQDSVFAAFPAYRRAQLGDDPPSLEAIRRTQVGTLVEYFISEEQALALVVEETGPARVVELANPAEWEADLANYLGQLADPAAELSAALGHRLYRLLVERLVLDPRGPVTIVPDGQLYLLPFGTLLTGAATGTDYAGWPWWSEVRPLRYAFSAQLLSFAADRRGRGNGRALALAPVARISPGDPQPVALELPATLRTVRHLSSLFPTDTLINAAAHREAFAERADAYSLLHLGTHAYLSDEKRKNGFLLYGEDFAYYGASDLANHDFRAELVVIGGCETGLGRELPGEGIASLGRSFALNGAPNLLLSLWSIDDAATADLLNTTYSGLAAGTAPAAALTAAQQHFLTANTHPRFAHPYYWAGLVYYGVEQPLSLAGGGWPGAVWLGGVLVIGVLAIYGLSGRIRRRRTAGVEVGAS